MAPTKTTAKEYYVFSTLSAPQAYTTWAPQVEGNLVRSAEHQVIIHGGANVATKQLFTPKGVMTKVSAEDYEHLLQNDVFKLHMKNNFIRVEVKNLDVEDVIEKGDMAERDDSAPVTPKTNPRNMGVVESKV